MADIELNVDVNLDTNYATGPWIEYPSDDPEVGARSVPDGWRADWASQIMTAPGRYRAPLIPIRPCVTDEQIEALRQGADNHELVALCDVALRVEDAWWTWHDAHQSQWGPTMGAAQRRATAWSAGDSDDGPDADAARQACADLIYAARHRAESHAADSDETVGTE